MANQANCYYSIVNTDLNIPPVKHAMHAEEFCTIGDMHGNPIKLIWVLMYLGILVFPQAQEQFAKLVELYHMDVASINEQIIQEFHSLLDSAEFHPENTRGLILIGDLLADRGQNDYFTLKVFEVLSQKQIPFEILLSNHDVNTIVFSERPPEIEQLLNLDKEFNCSLINLAEVLKKDNDLFEDIVRIIDSAYKPNLLALKLVKIKQQYFLFTHGVFDIMIFIQIMKTLDIPYEPKSIESFIESIAFINKLLSILLNKHHYHFIHSILHKFVWNRELTQSTVEFLRTHRIHLIHGHVGEIEIGAQEAKYHTNLDTNIGRPVLAPIQNKGHLKLFFHREPVQQSSSSQTLKS